MNNITPIDLEKLLGTHLKGISSLEDIFKKIKLKKDSNGNVSIYVVDNVKSALSIIIKIIRVEEANSPALFKYKRALIVLLNFTQKFKL